MEDSSPESSVLQRTLGTAEVKVESGDPSFAELHFLRSRVRDLEREKEDLQSENQRLKETLVHEIPGLLSTMWQTLGNGNHSVSTLTGRANGYPAYSQQQAATNQDAGFSPLVQQQEELSWEGEEGPPLGSHMGEEGPPLGSHMGGGGSSLQTDRHGGAEEELLREPVHRRTPGWTGESGRGVPWLWSPL
ncbi:hypothetical protein PBY51_015532 [Eleginops maclovinus]|uniref:Uncharacterized protein n=1 Tax=Eleginops maclovinus TaxID=56733 RepID=A0AAN8AGT4_ELEMC|nr:hypothetical protein PBY51_015532 [Eleginops maclovinus]